MAYLLLVVAGAISVLFAAGIFYLTLKPCKTSGISYLVGVPASFSLLTLSFIMNLCTTVLNSTQLLAGPILNVLYLLLETYGFLFLALTYARGTWARLIGKSSLTELAIELTLPTLITIAVIFQALGFENLTLSQYVSQTIAPLLRTAMTFAVAYLVYETSRNREMTRKREVIILAYATFLIEQAGFIMSTQWLPGIMIFLGYAGRISGLLLILGLCSVGVRKNDLGTIIRRLGLSVPKH